MEPERVGDADQPMNMQTAIQRFDDLFNSLELEQAKLLDLEFRRQELKEDLERLQSEIMKEKMRVIDATMTDGLEGDNQGYEQECEFTEAIPLDLGGVEEFIEDQREELASYANDPDLELLKDKLEQLENDYFEEESEESSISEVSMDE